MELKDLCEIFDSRPSRKIIGEIWVVSERIKKETKTKNTVTQTVIRKTVRHIDLDCGHSLPATEFNKTPKNKAKCFQCAKDQYEKGKE